MSKLDNAITDGVSNHTGEWANPFIFEGNFSAEQLQAILVGLQGAKRLKNNIKRLILELIGDVEQRETEDMSLKSWSTDDYKAFGKNELKLELRNKVEAL